MESPFIKLTQGQDDSQSRPRSVITAYDFPSAQLCEEAGVDAILVGDSLANVVLGYSSTRDVGMVEMEIFTAAARRGAPETHIIADLPYGADETDQSAVDNALRLVAAGADSVKIEGPQFSQIEAMIQAGVSVVGHLGLTPQTAKNYKQVAQDESEAQQLIQDAQRLAELGCIAFVVEHIPHELADQVTQKVSIPSIGIGAGVETDAQVMVFHDVLGLLGSYVPPIAHNFVLGHQFLLEGIQSYHEWVSSQVSLAELKRKITS